jgi:YesN/AraC family two-component response regulator
MAMHSIEDTTGDGILVNVLMQKEFLDTAFLSRISNQGSVAEFLVEAVLRNRKKEHFLFFPSHDNANVMLLMDNILLEYFERGIGYEEAWHSYMVILFTELLRSMESQTERMADRDEALILQVLSFIEREYASCTLKQAAASCGLNPNYLTTMLKQKTGFSFLEYVQRKKIGKARYYLENSDISVAEIAALCGYKNLNFFYQLFVREAGCTPAEYRRDYNLKYGQ